MISKTIGFRGTLFSDTPMFETTNQYPMIFPSFWVVLYNPHPLSRHVLSVLTNSARPAAAGHPSTRRAHGCDVPLGPWGPADLHSEAPNKPQFHQANISKHRVNKG